ncbi:MAG: hypothetical protein IPM89_02005 [Candidatus Competibacteraceae bacterium]|nr:MAG: hypothetical protein IPM89_02005 [Candidatus Competibacteraceae bacterium]
MFILLKIRLRQTNPYVVGHRIESGKLSMPCSVAHLLEMDSIPLAQIGYGSNGFCLFGIAGAGAAEGCGGAER